jgi:hypothetical protein
MTANPIGSPKLENVMIETTMEAKPLEEQWLKARLQSNYWIVPTRLDVIPAPQLFPHVSPTPVSELIGETSLGSFARGAAECIWTELRHRDKPVDVELLESTARVIQSWISYAEYCDRELKKLERIVSDIGKMFGLAARISAGETFHDDVIPEKIAGLVQDALADREVMRMKLQALRDAAPAAKSDDNLGVHLTAMRGLP